LRREHSIRILFVSSRATLAAERNSIKPGTQEVADQIPEWTKIGKSKHMQQQ